jgi:glutamine synthetase
VALEQKLSDDTAALKQSLADQGVKYLIASFVDMHGVSKAKIVPLSHINQMLQGSELYTGAALDGVPQDVSDEEVSAHPDPESAIVLPWRPEVAWFASDLWCEGVPFEPCSRNILKRQLQAALDDGYVMKFGMEAEFFVFKNTEDGGIAPLSSLPHLDKPAYDGTRLLDNLPWISDLVAAMNGLGWGVYSFDHEDGIGQFEIDFDYADALTMADRYVFFRFMANSIARQHGAFASFMPKPLGDRAGSGAHFNISLADPQTGTNLFKATADARGNKLCERGYFFLGGVLKHVGAICAVCSPTVNSYKRLIKQGSMSGFTWAPVFACYGNNNRTNSLRIPLAGGRVELRPADSACNPYLGAALVLAAGLEGIREQIDPGEPYRENMYRKTPEELETLGVKLLPRTLEEAIDAFESDFLTKEVFGTAMHQAWVDFKREEWSSYHNHVSDWERDRYLKFF